MKKLIVLPVLLLLLVCAQAQKMVIDKVQKAPTRNIAAIKEGTEVKGYYFFYISDKIDKRTNEYTLRIMDNSLNTLKDIKFTDSKYVSVLESSFNGTDLIFLFYNSDANTFEYQVYGADGKKKHIYTRSLTNKEEKYLKTTYLTNSADDEATFKGLYAIEGKGFISNMPSREDKDFTFQLDYFSSEKRKQWTYIPTEGAKVSMGEYLGTFNNTVFLSVLKFTSRMDQNPDSYLVGLDLDNGKKLFEKQTDGKYRFSPGSMSVLNTGKAYIFGEYFDLNGKIFKDKSLGLAVWGVDEQGKVLNEKYNSWSLEMSKYLEVSSKGKIEDFGYMYVHNILQASDGNIYVVGEGYRKAASAGGIIATAVFGSGVASTTKIQVTDMMVLKFDQDFNIKDAKKYEKNTSNVAIPSGYDFVALPRLGKIIKYYMGGFDYSYTQANKDYSSFTVCYEDYQRGKDYKGLTFNALSYNEGKFTTDRINTKSDASRTYVLQGPQGQVLLVDYYKKEKKIEAHFEKLN
jgi:hypothetical protein